MQLGSWTRDLYSLEGFQACPARWENRADEADLREGLCESAAVLWTGKLRKIHFSFSRDSRRDTFQRLRVSCGRSVLMHFPPRREAVPLGLPINFNQPLFCEFGSKNTGTRLERFIADCENNSFALRRCFGRN